MQECIQVVQARVPEAVRAPVHPSLGRTPRWLPTGHPQEAKDTSQIPVASVRVIASPDSPPIPIRCKSIKHYTRPVRLIHSSRASRHTLPMADSINTQNGSNTNTAGWIVALVAVVALVLLFLFFMMPRTSTAPAPNATGASNALTPPAPVINANSTINATTTGPSTSGSTTLR